MKIKRAVTVTGTLYETTTLMETFYFGGMAESLFSVEQQSENGKTVCNKHMANTRALKPTPNVESLRELSIQNGRVLELVFSIVHPRDSDINGP